MKKLLIVEDEKMIRQGIAAIVQRAPVPIEEIITCKNGEEAFEIVKNQKIDVMITDIRMPKKDGITLVKEIQALENIPKVVVISGYDDFSYAVEFLRYGAKEYMLKPVEREKIHSVLVRLEKELEAENAQGRVQVKIGFQELKQLLLKPTEGPTNIESIVIENFEDYFLTGEYVVCCTNYKSMSDACMSDILFLDDVEGQSVFVVKLENKDIFLKDLMKEHFVGVSRQHQSLNELRNAYQEALYARKQAFATRKLVAEYNQSKATPLDVSDARLEQFVQMIGTDKLEETNKFLAHILYQTKLGQIEPDNYLEIMNSIVGKICFNYRNILEIEENDIATLKNGYGFDHAECYHDAIFQWIKVIHGKISTEFDDYRNKQKIQKAIVYIHENFHNSLNMAVVSNYISMNYSLFSFAFKRYTGMNFVDYLKDIRIKEAKRLLEETDKKVIEISSLIGYDNEKNFMKIFKKVCGVSPSEYRKNVQVGRGV